MKRITIDNYLFVPVALALFAFALLMFTANNYGIFTDELYFVACAQHCDFGYVDQPPLVAWVTRVGMIFGNSLFVLRIVPALSFSGTLVLVALITKALGGSRFAASCACLSILSGTAFWVMFGYVSMNAYDIMLVTGASYLFIRILQGASMRLWILLGIVVGLGLNTKMTMLVYSFGLFAGIVLTDQRRLLLTRHPYIAALIAFGMFLPHVLWQAVNGWPTIEFIANANEKNLNLDVLTLLWQLTFAVNPLILPLLVTGLLALAWRFSQSMFRPLAIAVIVFFGIYLVNRSKFYYMLPVIPLLSASGSVVLERWTATRRRWLRTVAAFLIVTVGILTLPFGVPLMSIDSFASYVGTIGLAKNVGTERNEAKVIPGYFGQRIGWEDLVRTVASVYHALPDSDRTQCGILGFHYGESAAVDYFGAGFGLPKAIGRHNSYWLWGPEPYSGKIMVVIVSGAAGVDAYFRSIELRATYELPYVDGPFRRHRIYVCRDPVQPLPMLWRQLKTYD